MHSSGVLLSSASGMGYYNFIGSFFGTIYGFPRHAGGGYLQNSSNNKI
ncbi:MAG: hypothetical protein ACOC44_16985 [Promethearchaeia archaeon]